MRLSGLQLEVLALYRRCLREIRKKPAVSTCHYLATGICSYLIINHCHAVLSLRTCIAHCIHDARQLTHSTCSSRVLRKTLGGMLGVCSQPFSRVLVMILSSFPRRNDLTLSSLSTEPNSENIWKLAKRILPQLNTCCEKANDNSTCIRLQTSGILSTDHEANQWRWVTRSTTCFELCRCWQGRSRDLTNLMEGSRHLPKVLGVLQLRMTGEIPASYGIGDPQSMIVNGIFAMIPAASAIMALMYINSCNSRLAFILSLDNNTSSRFEACIICYPANP